MIMMQTQSLYFYGRSARTLSYILHSDIEASRISLSIFRNSKRLHAKYNPLLYANFYFTIITTNGEIL